MGSPTSKPEILFTIEHPGEKLTMAEAQALLEPLGVRLDRKYGPVSMRDNLHYVVRGTATSQALARVRELDGVKVFADNRIAPAAR